MNHRPPQDSTRLSEAQRRALLSRLEDGGQPVDDNRREARRWRLEGDIDLVVRHPGGTTAAHRTPGRNLSAGGVSLLHGGFLHVGCDCTVTLRDCVGRPREIAGVIASCRLVEGRVHEVGVRFNEKIDPARFVETSSDGGGGAAAWDALTGDVLFVEPGEADAELLSLGLAETSIQIRRVETTDAALARLSERVFDAMIIEPLAAPDPLAALDQILAVMPASRLLVTTAETEASTLQAIRGRGVRRLLTKPLDSEALQTQIRELITAAGGIVAPEDLGSPRVDDEQLQDIIGEFRSACGVWAERLVARADESDLTSVRQICIKIKAASSELEFMGVAGAAFRTLSALEGGASPAEADAPRRRLALLCRRLADAA